MLIPVPRTWFRRLFRTARGRRRTPPEARPVFLALEQLEARVVPSAGTATPQLVVAPLGSLPSGVRSQGLSFQSDGVFTPLGIETAYSAVSLYGSNYGGDAGQGQTIAVVDAYDDPAFVSSGNSGFLSSDLAVFDSLYGLPNPPSFLKVSQTGSQTQLPQTDPSGPKLGDWETEEALDVEYAHAMAPEANILLVECKLDQRLGPLRRRRLGGQARRAGRRRRDGRLHELRRGRRFLRRDGRRRLLLTHHLPGRDLPCLRRRRRPRRAFPRRERPGRLSGGLAQRGGRRRDHADGRRGEWRLEFGSGLERIGDQRRGHGRRRQQLREPAELPGDCRGPVQHDEARRAGRRPRRRPANRGADLRFLRPPGRQPLREPGVRGEHRPPRRHEPGQPAHGRRRRPRRPDPRHRRHDAAHRRHADIADPLRPRQQRGRHVALRPGLS